MCCCYEFSRYSAAPPIFGVLSCSDNEYSSCNKFTLGKLLLCFKINHNIFTYISIDSAIIKQLSLLGSYIHKLHVELSTSWGRDMSIALQYYKTFSAR